MEGAATTMSTVITAMGDVFSLSGTVLNAITGNPILLFCLAAGLAPVGISMLRRLRRAAF